jgi:hypothetical protein
MGEGELRGLLKRGLYSTHGRIVSQQRRSITKVQLYVQGVGESLPWIV